MQIDRLTAAENEKWDLTVLYPGDDAWSASKTALEGKLAGLAGEQGHLGESASRLLGALRRMSGLRMEFERLSSYAHMKSDLDRRVSEDLARAQEIDVLRSRLEAAASFMAPEILDIPDETIETFLRTEPGLHVYAHLLDDVRRRRPHTLTPPEEKILADSRTLSTTPDDVYGVLATADLPWPEVTLSDGARIRLDQSEYVRARTSPIRQDRLEIFRSFFGTWTAYSRTCGVLFDAEVKKNIFYARARRYPSALAAALDRNRVPVEVYDAMTAAAHEGLPSLHRYLRLRARMLGVSDLGYHDLYAPLAAESERSYSVPEARSLLAESLAPLGREYVEVLDRGFDERWVDFWPTQGKKSGAYSNGEIYGEHPFILMNYNGNFDAVSTLAHEFGHAMHSHLANATQPYPTADYSIFVAEVASTFNEALLANHAIERRPTIRSAWRC